MSTGDFSATTARRDREVTALFKVHRSGLVRLAQSFEVGEDAPDVVQEAFLQHHREIVKTGISYDEKDAKRMLVARVRNIARDWLKHTSRRDQVIKRRGAGVVNAEATDPVISHIRNWMAPQHGMERREVRRLVAAAVDRLEPGQRAVITLIYRDGMRATEVAELLGIDAGTVRERRRKGEAKLLKWLSPLGLSASDANPNSRGTR